MHAHQCKQRLQRMHIPLPHMPPCRRRRLPPHAHACAPSAPRCPCRRPPCPAFPIPLMPPPAAASAAASCHCYGARGTSCRCACSVPAAARAQAPAPAARPRAPALLAWWALRPTSPPTPLPPRACLPPPHASSPRPAWRRARAPAWVAPRAVPPLSPARMRGRRRYPGRARPCTQMAAVKAAA